MKKKIPGDPKPSKVDYSVILIKFFFPSIKGKSELLDDYLSDQGYVFHETVVKVQIKFTSPDDKDPDKLVSCCDIYLFQHYYL